MTRHPRPPPRRRSRGECNDDGCGRPVFALGKCASHYRHPGKQLRPYRRTPWQVALDAFYELDQVLTLNPEGVPAIKRAEANLRVAMIRYARTPKLHDPHRRRRRRGGK